MNIAKFSRQAFFDRTPLVAASDDSFCEAYFGLFRLGKMYCQMYFMVEHSALSELLVSQLKNATDIMAKAATRGAL